MRTQLICDFYEMLVKEPDCFCGGGEWREWTKIVIQIMPLPTSANGDVDDDNDVADVVAI